MADRPARRVMLRRIAWPNVRQHLQHHAFAFAREVEVGGPAKILAVYRDRAFRDGPNLLYAACPCEAVAAPSRLTLESAELAPLRPEHFDFGGATTWDEAARTDLTLGLGVRPVTGLWFPVPQVDFHDEPHTLYADVVPDEGFITEGEVVGAHRGGTIDEAGLLTERGLDPQNYRLVREEGGWRITRKDNP